MTRGWAARRLAIAFVLIVALLHAMRPDVSPLQRGISRYANGPTFVLMTIAFLALDGTRDRRVGPALVLTRSDAVSRRSSSGWSR